MEYMDTWSTKVEAIFSEIPQPNSTKNSKTSTSDQSIAAAVSAKLEDGNIKAAAKILCSDDTPAEICDQTFADLQSKHPTPPPDRQPVPPPPDTEPLQLSESNIRALISTFPAGSAGGPDGLRPQHLLELIKSAEAGPALVSSVTALTNLLLNGICPQEIRPLLFGGTLFALKKKTGGLRPIAIGYLWRRLASKGANAHAIPKVTPYLSPKQLGVAVPGGAEAAVHASRRFLSSMEPDCVFVKLDISNAFNSLHRDRMLSSINTLLPELAPYCHLAYEKPSQLKFGSYTILSSMGPQQGDPLGPLLFCLPLQTALLKLTSPLAFGFLDDISLGGPTASVAADMASLEADCADLGLSLNRSKCELTAKDLHQVTNDSFAQFARLDEGSISLLGAPLSPGPALQGSLDARVNELNRALNRLVLIARQDALLILRSSLGAPRLLHSLRCAPCAGHPTLDVYDKGLRKGLEDILNINLTDTQWSQSTLPIGMGGLGIRRASSLALPAFLASAAGTLALQSEILSQLEDNRDQHVEALEAEWRSEAQTDTTNSFPTHIQSKWDQPLLQRKLAELFATLPEKNDQARLKAVSSQHASDWLHALPITSCGLRLSDEAIRVAVGIRLGANLCQPHTCACGALVTAKGTHGLSCALGFGRTARHASINDLIHRSLIKAGFPATKEPQGMLRSDGRRPDGTTLIPWRAGRHLVWDATVIDTLAPSYLHATATTAGAAAEIADERKKTKYQDLLNSHHFIPLAVETLGPINEEGITLITDIGRHTTRQTDEMRETSFLFQRLSVIIHRFNAVAFAGTFSASLPVSGHLSDPRCA